MAKRFISRPQGQTPDFSYYEEYTTVLADLTRNFKGKQWDEADVLEWCMHVETRVVPDIDYMVRYIDYPLTITDGRIYIPPFAYKVINYSLDGQVYVDVSKRRFEHYMAVDNTIHLGSVYISFVGMPINKNTGEPLIIKGHEQLCYWYCVRSAYMEDFFLGKIDHGRWEYIDSKVAMIATEIKQSLKGWDEDDFKNLAFVMGTNIAHLGGYVRNKLR